MCTATDILSKDYEYLPKRKWAGFQKNKPFYVSSFKLQFIFADSDSSYEKLTIYLTL